MKRFWIVGSIIVHSSMLLKCLRVHVMNCHNVRACSFPVFLVKHI